MESLCLMKNIDNFILTTMEEPFSRNRLPCTNFRMANNLDAWKLMQPLRRETALKRSLGLEVEEAEIGTEQKFIGSEHKSTISEQKYIGSEQENFDSDISPTPPKQRRIHTDDVKPQIFRTDHVSSTDKESKSEDAEKGDGCWAVENIDEDKSSLLRKETKTELANGMDGKHDDISPLLQQTEANSQKLSPRFNCSMQIKSQSLSRLDLTSDTTAVSSLNSNLVSQLENTIEQNELENHQEIVRCKSLPSRMTPESEVEEETEAILKKNNNSPYRRLLKVYPHQNYDKESDRIKSQNRVFENSENEVVDHDVNQVDDNDHESCPPTPSSCFIDIETETPPSSPLNLTITTCTDLCHKEELEDNTDEDFKVSDTPNQSKMNNSVIQNSVTDSSFNTATKEICSENLSQSLSQVKKGAQDQPKERKTNFSIDAILRPDFGSINPASKSPTTFQKRQHSHITSRPVSSLRSPHSAFTAVDLSTRPRSDSLSSPSSASSSSPSPPLSSTSPAFRHSSEFSPTGMHNKFHTGQENFLLSPNFFPNPSRDLENFIGRHFPFMNPSHDNGLAKCPRFYPNQTSPIQKLPTTSPSKSRYPPHQSTPSKNDHALQNDISKLFSRSLNPFFTSPQNNRTESQKQSMKHGHQINSNDPALQVLGHNLNSKTPQDLNSLIANPSKRHHDIKTVSNATSQSTANKPNSAKDSSVKDSPVLKQEKASPTETKPVNAKDEKEENPLWPAWVFCTRYSDRPSSGPRSRKPKRNKAQDEKRPRTAFTNDQLQRLKREFEDCRYLTETRRKSLADELGLTESQIKIWFQNKRAKIKKSVGVRNPLALQLMEQGLYNHSTVKMMEDGTYREVDIDAGMDSS